ncbi:MAG: DUF3108 domain-containing protein [Alphaproteobacteria bacterium]|nr:DUF3108 domain-containing protein [Alphaproteobacteria bacterium]
MSFRRAFCLFSVLTAGLPSIALAQGNVTGGRQVEIGYAITYLGFTGFRIDFKARFENGRYDAESHTFKEGLIKAVTMGYEGRNRAWGGFTLQGGLPSAGSLSIVVDRKPRTWLAQYGPGGALSETHNPPWQPRPDQVIPDKDRIGSLDPLSAALGVGFRGDAACDTPVLSNDGKRRIDIILKKVGTESPAAAGVPAAKGDLLVCEIYTKRVSGEFDDAPQEAESKREEPMRLWFARLDDTPFRYPVKLEARQTIGTIHGMMLSFNERPL